MHRLLTLLLLLPVPAFAQVPLRVAIVGLEHGHVAGLLAAFPKQNEVQLVGILDADPALRARYAKQFHLEPSLFFPDLDALLAFQKPQALLVYTSIGRHRRVIEQAAAHGISVMVEKPLTLSLADALAIRAAARAHHIQVLVNYETTWYASNRAAFDQLASGRLGPLRKAVIHDGHEGPAEIGVQSEFLHWLTDPAQAGAGALYDFGCYGADLMTWLMHGEAPLSVTAVAQSEKPGKYPRVDDDATIVLAYPHAQAVLLPSWNWPFSRKDMELYGTTGYAITVGPNNLRLRLKGQNQDENQQQDQERELTAPPLPPPNDTPLHYLAAVLGGRLTPRRDLTALDTNIIVMQILDAARESARTRRTVLLKPLPPV